MISSRTGQDRKGKSRTNNMDKWGEWGEVRSVGIGMGYKKSEVQVGKQTSGFWS